MLTRFSGDTRPGGTSSALEEKFGGCGETTSAKKFQYQSNLLWQSFTPRIVAQELIWEETKLGSTARQAAASPSPAGKYATRDQEEVQGTDVKTQNANAYQIQHHVLSGIRSVLC